LRDGCSREGQLIFHYIYQLSGCKKPALRLWTSSLTESAIKEAYANLKPISEYANLRDVAIASIAKRLGHSSVNTTQERYLHIIQELESQDNDKIVRHLSALI